MIERYKLLYRSDGAVNSWAARKNTELVSNLKKETAFLLETATLAERLYALELNKTSSNCLRCSKAISAYRDYCQTCTTLANPEVKEKFRKKMKELYGHEHSLQVPEFKAKALVSLGGIWALDERSEVRKSFEVRCLKLHGIKSFGSTKEAFEKVKSTKLSRYGSCFTSTPISKEAQQKLSSKQWLENEHYALKKPLSKIAIELGVHESTISSYLHSAGLKVRRFVSIASQGELQIAQFLSDHKVEFQTQATFNDCINPKTNRKLRFDFWLPKLNTLIEFDGAYHFLLIVRDSEDQAKKNLAYEQYKDSVKNFYCQEKGLKLIRISCFEKDYTQKLMELL